MFADFDLQALYDALDAERAARGMSWREAARDISRSFVDSPARPIAASTLTGLRDRGVAEGDGVLQILRWLGRAPESFIPGCETDETHALPAILPHQILRFDTRLIHVAMDARRTALGMSWEDVAREIPGFSAASLRNLAKGGRTSFPHVARIARWLEQPIARFTRAADR